MILSLIQTLISYLKKTFINSLWLIFKYIRMPNLILLKDIIIAIDGHSGCGKSTTAKGVARELEYAYVDSGAMYRAVTLYFIENNIDLEDDDEVKKALKKIILSFSFSKEKGFSEIILNGQNVEEQIRTMDVSKMVSKVSSIVAVRHQMVAQQRLMGKQKKIVMDGRDIGSNVFPKAELKFYFTANIEVRVERRMKELEAKGINANFEEVKANLLSRDKLDQSRKENPLIKSIDAKVMDTSFLTIEEQIRIVKKEALQIINSK